MINPIKQITLARSAISVATILVLAPLVSLVPIANAQDQDISVTAPPKKLTSQWWQWILSIPVKDNPLLDTTGEKCQAGDMGDVFFLVGGGVDVVRECTISEGQEILFPIINSNCIDKPGGLREPHTFPDEPGVFDPPKGRPGSCIEDPKGTIDKVTTLEVTIDGVSIENLKENFRVQSNPYPVKLPEDNIIEFQVGVRVPPGTYVGISDGYWVLVEPLPVGEHTIHFVGRGPFTQDITYHLTVE